MLSQPVEDLSGKARPPGQNGALKAESDGFITRSSRDHTCPKED